jgi:hypothetical protein
LIEFGRWWQHVEFPERIDLKVRRPRRAEMAEAAPGD